MISYLLNDSQTIAISYTGIKVLFGVHQLQHSGIFI